MRGHPVALLSGIGRRAALAILACGFVVLALGLLLQAGKQQRLYRDLHQQALRQSAQQAADAVQGRIESAETVLRALTSAVQRDRAGNLLPLRARLLQTGQFSRVVLIESQARSFAMQGERAIPLSDAQREGLESGRAVLVNAPDRTGIGHLYLGLQAQPGAAPVWVFAELAQDWLWAQLRHAESRAQMLALDAAGAPYFRTLENIVAVTAVATDRLSPDSSPAIAADLAWNAGATSWVGAMAAVGMTPPRSGLPLVIVAADPDQPWSVAFWSALRTQSTMLPILVLLAAVLAHRLVHTQVRTLRSLRRSVAQLPERRTSLVEAPGADPEIRQLVQTFNRTAEAIEAQAETRKALEEIDALLLTGGDHESVVDQVLSRVREVTGANNVGLTMVDSGVAGHGRLFAVNSQGGCPVNRVVLDEQMLHTLRESRTGLTIVRCEEGRHSFLEPMQSGGSAFFWVWPVLVADELAAILAVGYVEPPPHGARVAGCGTLCAQRFGISLSSNARAERLYRQAHFDPLTQLPNRLLFRDQLSRELAESEHSGAQGALLYVDLDHFKKVNDSLGHAAGDQLLSIVAQRLRACVKDGDTVARLGGDEFTIILRNVADAASVSAVADRIIHSMLLPVRLDGKDHQIRASIGVTMYPADGTQLDALLRNADLAMYRAKDQGRGAAVFYNAKMVARGARVADSGLYRALKRREFSLYFQPQYRVSNGALVGVEALLRWQKPVGMVASADFIPAAEESGLIVDLGSWVIEAACVQIAQWRDAGVQVPAVAVNLSVQQLRDPELVGNVRRFLERYRLQPAALEFEMNEAALMDPDSQTCVEELAVLGVRLTLDDFGTGHTALANLRRYPVSTVKIDRSFVAELSENPAAAALASTIIVMAQSLGKQVVAEGVETIEQLEYLRERGCDVAQGYFMARPLSAADMTELLVGRQPQADSERSAMA